MAQMAVNIPNSFSSQTQRHRAKLAPQGRFTSLNSTVTVPLAKAGYGTNILARVVGTITTGAGASGFWSSNFPYSLINRVRVGGNDGNQLTDVYGVELPAINQRFNRGFDPRVTPPNNPATVTSVGAPSGVAVYPVPGSAISASTTYLISIPVLVPIALWFDNARGVAFLQSNQSTVNLDITLGGVSDLTAGGLGTSPVISLDVEASLEYFLPGVSATPNMDFAVKRTTQQIGWTASGVQNYSVPVSLNTLVALDMRFLNAGVPQAFYATAGNPLTPNFDTIYYSYATSTTPERRSLWDYLMDHRLMYGIDASDGVIKFDFGNGLEGVGNSYNPRDFIPEAQLTELIFSVGTSIVPAAGSTILVTRTELVPSAEVQARAAAM